MGLFRRRLGGEPPAQPDPVLAPLTVTEAADLVRLAERAASERGLEARYDGDGALVTEDGMVAGLTNLARAVSGIAGGTGMRSSRPTSTSWPAACRSSRRTCRATWTSGSTCGWSPATASRTSGR